MHGETVLQISFSKLMPMRHMNACFPRGSPEWMIEKFSMPMSWKNSGIFTHAFPQPCAMSMNLKNQKILTTLWAITATIAPSRDTNMSLYILKNLERTGRTRKNLKKISVTSQETLKNFKGSRRGQERRRRRHESKAIYSLTRNSKGKMCLIL